MKKSTTFIFLALFSLLCHAQTTMDKILVTIGSQTKSVTLADNAATEALVKKLQQSPVKVTLNSSGDFEIWGSLGFSLPTSDRNITAQPGDVILYNGSNICIFYGLNSWSYTRLGKIDGLSASELRTFLHAGERDISVTLSLTNTTGIESISSTPSTEDVDSFYTLNGVKVNNPQKGVYVKNGRKVIL